MWGKPLAAVLADASVPPDLELPTEFLRMPPGLERLPHAPIRWTHRRGPGWDLYFLSNQFNTPLKVTATFRVAGRRPELWDAGFGAIEKVAEWREKAGRTIIPLSFDPSGSLFVVFSQPTDSTDREASSTSIPGSGSHAVRSHPAQPLALNGPWLARFTDRVAQPVELTLHRLSSWTEQANDDVKYYSGTATYTTDFNIPKAMVGPDKRLSLELGDVHDLVEVWLNDQHVGVLWKPPFSIDITHAARTANNKLRLEVTNTWRNRLIGDYGKEPADRKTFVVPPLRLGKQWLPGGPGTVLSPAGLLGPVLVRCVAGCCKAANASSASRYLRLRPSARLATRRRRPNRLAAGGPRRNSQAPVETPTPEAPPAAPAPTPTAVGASVHPRSSLIRRAVSTTSLVSACIR